MNNMEHVVQELRQVVNDFAAKINDLSEAELSVKVREDKWSKKEVVGHLIDSAQSNLRRFVCGQYEPTPPKIVYDQNFWVTANGYQCTKKEDIILLWKLINERIADILMHMPAENYSRQCDNSKKDVQLHTLSWLAEDYVKHMKHHLNQIIPGSFDIIYT